MFRRRTTRHTRVHWDDRRSFPAPPARRRSAVCPSSHLPGIGGTHHPWAPSSPARRQRPDRLASRVPGSADRVRSSRTLSEKVPAETVEASRSFLRSIPSRRAARTQVAHVWFGPSSATHQTTVAAPLPVSRVHLAGSRAVFRDAGDGEGKNVKRTA